MKHAHLRKHWDRLDADDVAKAQLKQLRAYLTRTVLPASEHYRDVFRRYGVDVDALRTPADLVRIPFTTKEDLLPTPERPDRPRAFVLAPGERDLARRPSTVLRALTRGRAAAREALEREFRPVLMTATTGRSSESVPFVYTHHDLDNLAIAGRRMMEVCDSRKEFRHLNVFPFAPHLAFWQMHYAGLGFNTFCLSTGGGKTVGTEGNVTLLRKIKPDAIIGMPTFIYHLLCVAVEEGVRVPNLCRIVLGGEKAPAGLRGKLRALAAELGAPALKVMSTYGFTEAKTAWPECAFGNADDPTGFHLYPDRGILEVVDPRTGEPVGEGEAGEVVYTPLDARGSVVLRYRTGDLVEGGLVHEPCPACGRTMPRLMGRISRVSNRKAIRLGKLKGTLVSFDELEHILDDESGLGAWQLELRKANDDPLDLDELIVHVEAKDESEAALREAITKRFESAAEIRPNRIIFHSARRMRALQGVGQEIKEARVVDNRPEPEVRGGAAFPGNPKPESVS